MTATAILDLFRDEELRTIIAASVIGLFVLLASTVVLRKPDGTRKQSWIQGRLDALFRRTVTDIGGALKPSAHHGKPSAPAPPSGPPVDVWAERAARGVAPASLNRKRGAGEARPFGSGYYYAHNDAQRTGGYADGLRMEDYAMNGPRLLSRSGSVVSADALPEATASGSGTDGPGASQPVAARETNSDSGIARPRSARRVLVISKYLWDDASSVGTIRIDRLPLPSGDMVTWKDAGVVDHAAVLRDNGLLVTVTTGADYECQLHIRLLYAGVADVSSVVAKGNKRLLVKLSKTKRQDWPHPQVKMS